ncbi:hypothetical protein PCL_01575 [Purpureocillium lilacinum]|uniref:Uncharacterized protein n=1 Tax=Purpureocillium lilacinum TaxID=33203 RepID=A0A2U3DNZ3_PURLI|nr:hypothetical protein PCL_01575 [Purpureocillium lilacinum]
MFPSQQAREMPPSQLLNRPLSAAHRAPNTNPAVFAGPPQGRAGPPQHPEPDVQGQLLSHAQALAALHSSYRSAITPSSDPLYDVQNLVDISDPTYERGLLEQWQGEQQREERDERHRKLQTMDDRIKLLKLQITFLLHKKGHDGGLVSEEVVTAQEES